MGMPKELSDAERDVIVESLRWRSDDLIRLLKDFVYASKEYMVQDITMEQITVCAGEIATARALILKLEE